MMPITLFLMQVMIELALEGYRYWDLRRWNLNLSQTAMGVSIEDNNFDYINVENRAYQDYMQYGPVPYSELLKFEALQQNEGW